MSETLTDLKLCRAINGTGRKNGSIVDNTVVTSPNADYAPEILRPSTEVKLRVPDATLWPQPYLDNYPFLSVIPRKTQDPNNI